MEITCHVDPSCPWTWVTSRWLLRAAEIDELEVRWASFSLAHLHRGHDSPMAATHAAGAAALRVVQHLLDRDDQPAVGRYYAAFGQLVHREGQPPSPELAAEAARRAGLDDDAVASTGDGGLDAAVAAATEMPFAAAGPDIGSPVLHWQDDSGGTPADVWIFGPSSIVPPTPPAPPSSGMASGISPCAPCSKSSNAAAPAAPNLSPCERWQPTWRSATPAPATTSSLHRSMSGSGQLVHCGHGGDLVLGDRWICGLSLDRRLAKPANAAEQVAADHGVALFHAGAHEGGEGAADVVSH